MKPSEKFKPAMSTVDLNGDPWVWSEVTENLFKWDKDDWKLIRKWPSFAAMTAGPTGDIFVLAPPNKGDFMETIYHWNNVTETFVPVPGRGANLINMGKDNRMHIRDDSNRLFYTDYFAANKVAERARNEA